MNTATSTVCGSTTLQTAVEDLVSETQGLRELQAACTVPGTVGAVGEGRTIEEYYRDELCAYNKGPQRSPTAAPPLA